VPRYQVNQDAVKKAESLIDSHHYVLESQWGDAQPPTDDVNAHLDKLLRSIDKVSSVKQ